MTSDIHRQERRQRQLVGVIFVVLLPNISVDAFSNLRQLSQISIRAQHQSSLYAAWAGSLPDAEDDKAANEVAMPGHNPYQAFHDADIVWATDIPSWNPHTERHEHTIRDDDESYTSLFGHLQNRWQDLSDMREKGDI